MRNLILTAVALLLVACSKSRQPISALDSPFHIVATDSGFIMPDTLHAGLNHFVFENRAADVHECMFIRLPAGMSKTDYIAQVASGVDFPEGAIDCSGPGLTSPGQRVEMWVALEEGTYMTGCWYRKHMGGHPQHTFVVRGAPAVPVAPPHEDVTLRMVDFRYDLLGKIERGTRTVRIQTDGPSMHEVDVFRLDEGRTIDDARSWMLNDQQGSPPGTVIGGALDSHDLSRPIWIRYEFTPARYVFWCDMPMVQTSEANTPHATHAEAGMFKEIVVE